MFRAWVFRVPLLREQLAAFAGELWNGTGPLGDQGVSLSARLRKDPPPISESYADLSPGLFPSPRWRPSAPSSRPRLPPGFRPPVLWLRERAELVGATLREEKCHPSRDCAQVQCVGFVKRRGHQAVERREHYFQEITYYGGE